MRISRIYYPGKLTVGSIVALEDAASHHIATVLRMRVGAAIILFNDQGGEYRAQIKNILKHKTEVELLEFIDIDRESPLQIYLGQGVSRGERMDYTIQKAVELGVTHITPLITERCGVNLSQERWEHRWQHWQAVVLGACEQSGRTRVPRLDKPLPLVNWLVQTMPGSKLVLAPDAELALNEAVTDQQAFTLLMGSEGGLSDAEIALAKAQQFQPCKLGPRILRTETAAVSVISILQNRFGDLNRI